MANPLAGAMDQADHGAQIGLEEVDGFEDAAALRRLLLYFGRDLQRVVKFRRRTNIFPALSSKPSHLGPEVR